MDEKIAAGDSGEFARWALANYPDPLSESEIRSFITGKLGLEVKPPRKPRGGPRFQVGDEVSINKNKHKNAETLAVYEEFHGKVGEVTDSDSTGVTVKFRTGGTGVFPDAQKLRGVGIYKYTSPFVMQGSPAMEMVYLAEAKEIADEQRVIVEKYLSNGKRETRSGNYYSGYAFSASVNQGGQVYFSVFPQQRVEVDPAHEGGFLPRSFNPTKGEVIYLGLLGKRPSGWKQQWESQNSGEGDIRAASLRSRTIRLAHSKPELRPYLLPILKEAASPLDRARRHQLMPANVRGKIPAIGSQENVEDPIAWVKFFSPYSGAVWYITEFDGRDEMFGWADLGMGGGELGYIPLSELENAERRGLPLVERDLSWRPRPLSQAK